jgi:hypothetical protein
VLQPTSTKCSKWDVNWGSMRNECSKYSKYQSHWVADAYSKQPPFPRKFLPESKFPAFSFPFSLPSSVHPTVHMLRLTHRNQSQTSIPMTDEMSFPVFRQWECAYLLIPIVQCFPLWPTSVIKSMRCKYLINSISSVTSYLHVWIEIRILCLLRTFKGVLPRIFINTLSSKPAYTN